MALPVVPEGWKPRLRAYLRARHGDGRDYLSAVDFPSGQSVILRFADGSQALFRYAIALTNEGRSEAAVFTEHCGYHVFPLGDGELEVVQSVSLGEVENAKPSAAADRGRR